ncbi:hypothetical protein LSH36_106g01006 [Paralvinella palmiformis]|uniref:Ankyrin repeat protein n=1 Tax=Paralvinella palmiformis TaxID=53620 RepID=A0AAD9NBF0_9ANNE|nr:hypothetical protein LSH36_106g01006 [Paralvinella palmiformis]
MADPEWRSFCDVIRTGDLDLITDVLDSESIDLDGGDRESNWETPLMLLCHSDLDEEDAAAILELMLLKIPDVNRQDGDGRTVLCHACMTGLTYFIQRLAQVSQCDPNMADNYGNTAVMFGVYYGEEEVVRVLLEAFSGRGRNVDVTRRNDEGFSAIIIAEQNGFTEIVDLLSRFTSKLVENEDVDVDGQKVRRLNLERNEVITSSVGGSHVGSKTNDFRRRKFKPAAAAQNLAPLVVQNRFQSSKSADYKQKSSHPGDERRQAAIRQTSYSAGISDQYHVICDVSEKLLYQTEQFDEQYLAEDERSDSTTSGESGDRSLRETSLERSTADQDRERRIILQDEGFDERPTIVNGRRKPSISLPDLRNKRTPPGSNYSDSGYDTRSGRTTMMREELSLPEIPEPDSSSNEDDYTPRTRRDSLSLPDLRGLRRCLVGSPSAMRRGSPRLNGKEIAKAALVDIRKNEVIRDADSLPANGSDDDFETVALNTARKSDDVGFLTLPNVAETKPLIADAKNVPSSQRYKAWGTPRPNNTPRAPTITELNKKMATRHKMLTDRA